MENRTHIKSIPFLSPTGQVYVTVLGRRVILIEHYIDESLIRRFRVERHFVALESTGGSATAWDQSTMKLSVCFALVPGQPDPVQLVPGPVHTLNFASVFRSVISIGASRSAPLIVIFDVSAFANTSAGIATRRKGTKTESSRFTATLTHRLN